MKKVVSVMLVLAMALALFACNGGTSKTSGSPPASSAASAPPASSSPTASKAPSASPAASASAAASAPASAAPSAQKKYGGILKLVNQAEGAAPIGLPWKTANIESLLLNPFFEYLIQAYNNGDLKPMLAESWKVDKDHNEIVLNIRQGVKFTDGSAFTASVAGWNIMKAVESKTANTHIKGVEARGDYVLAVKYDTWANGIVFGLSGIGMSSQEAYEKNGEAWAKENPVGTGPFIMTEYIHGQVIKAKKNPNYWQAGKPYLDGIEFRFIRDVTTQNMAMQATGESGIDALGSSTAEQLKTLKDMGTLNVVTMPGAAASLWPSSKNADSPMSKLEVRQAIGFAIDREAVCAARGFGFFTPGVQYLSSATKAYLPDSYNLTYNPTKAKELLAKVGYPNGFKTTIIVQPGLVDRNVGEILQAMLGKVGITAELQYPDAGGYAKIRTTGWEGLCLAASIQMSYVFISFQQYFDKNYTLMVSIERPKGWSEALDAAEQTPELEADKVQELQKMVLQNGMAIPVYFTTSGYIYKPNVHDTLFDKSQNSNLADAWLS